MDCGEKITLSCPLGSPISVVTDWRSKARVRTVTDYLAIILRGEYHLPGCPSGDKIPLPRKREQRSVSMRIVNT